MRNLAFFLLLCAAGVPAFGQVAEVQTRFHGQDEAEQAFWSELYPSGGETLFCGKTFASDEGLAITAVYGVREIRQALRCTTTNQCAVQTPRYLNMIGDLHNLYPNEAGLEEQRRNDRFGEVAGNGPTGECGLRSGFKLLEPPASARGNIARALFHMHAEYDLPLPTALEILQRWHRDDPADQVERIRNDRIAMLQGTRNRFIDDPAQAQRLAKP
jgi:deoxyribonuclease-1